MLDGGQFLFIVVETIKGSAINLKLKVALFNLSYLFIMALFVFVIFNDLEYFEKIFIISCLILCFIC